MQKEISILNVNAILFISRMIIIKNLFGFYLLVFIGLFLSEKLTFVHRSNKKLLKFLTH